MVNIVVCVKVTYDIGLIGVDPSTKSPVLKDVPYKISDFDLNAIEEAIRIKERHGGKVTSIIVAPIGMKEPIKRALAMGVDEAYFVTIDEGQLDSHQVSKILATFLSGPSGYDMIICGEGSVDEYNSQIGPRLSELLDVPLITYSNKVKIDGGIVTAERSLEDVKQLVQCPLPVILTVGSEINEPRFPTLLQIMGASKKPMKILSAKELDINLDELQTMSILSISAPVSQRRRIRIDADPEDAARKLALKLIQEGLVS